MECEKVCGVVARMLIKAGHKIDANNADHEDILLALSDYEDKYGEMLEHILMEKSI